MKIRLVLSIFLSLLLFLPATTGATLTTINYNGSSLIDTANTWDNTATDKFEDVIDRLFGTGYTLDLVNVAGGGGIETWFGKGAQTVILEEIAGFKNNTSFGWYDKNDPSTIGQIYTGPENSLTAPKSTMFGERQFGFYIDPNGISGNRMYTEHLLNGGEYQVAIFQINGLNDYLLAWEDLSLTGSTDSDYQDMMVRMSVASVPEASTLILLGIGLIGLTGFRRKFKKKRK